MTYLQVLWRRSLERRRFRAYRSLIATPEDLGAVLQGEALSPLPLPAGAYLGLSHDSPVAAGDLSLGDRALPALEADQIFFLGWFGRGRPVTVSGGAEVPLGTVTVHVFDWWRRAWPIATGVFE